MPKAIASGMATADETSPALISACAVATPEIGVREEVLEFMQFTYWRSGGHRQTEKMGRSYRRSEKDRGRTIFVSHCNGTRSHRQSRSRSRFPANHWTSTIWK